jgi:hypothetical protein
MSTYDTSAPTSSPAAQTWFVGRAYFYLRNPEDTLAGGYDRIKVQRRKGPTDPVWVEITKPATRLVIEPGRINYWYVDEKVDPRAEYMPVLHDSTGVLPDVPQTGMVQRAVDDRYTYVLTPEELKDRYAWGLLGIFVDGDGNPFPDRLYAHYIQYGIGKFEAKTRLRILPTPVLEHHDYSPAENADGRYWTFLLDEFPLVSVESVVVRLPGLAPQTIPPEWLRVDTKLGLVDVVPDPNTARASSLMIPGMFRGNVSRFTPQAVEIAYTAGFPLGQVPQNIIDMIGKEAVSGPLNLGGDLVGGAAIASQSMSIDGLSQSVNTTSSATNAGFGSRLIQYNNELKRDYPVIINLYKGPRLYVG